MVVCTGCGLRQYAAASYVETPRCIGCEACDDVWSTYWAWTDCDAAELGRRFAAYQSALDREETTAIVHREHAQRLSAPALERLRRPAATAPVGQAGLTAFRSACMGTPIRERTIPVARFMYLYRGPAPTLTPEQAEERMAAFGAWMERVGPALVDVGRPFGASGSVRDDGTDGTTGDLTGYTIVEADDLAAAKALTDGLPFLSDSDGKHAVEIFELLPM
jgi:hypothetical protein